MTVTAEDVQRLRHATGVGMMDAKRALEACEGDFESATRYLREKGLIDAARREARAATEGTIGHYLHQTAGYPTVGVLVELSCETDFVAKSDELQDLAHQVALHIAARRPSWVTVEEVPASVLDEERRVMAKQAQNDGKPADIVPRIVEGRLKTFYQDRVLYEQAFVNPDRFEGTIGDLVRQLGAQMGENVGVRRFARLAVGED